METQNQTHSDNDYKTFREMAQYFHAFHQSNGTTQDSIKYIEHETPKNQMEYLTLHGKEFPLPRHLSLELNKFQNPFHKSFKYKPQKIYTLIGSTDFTTDNQFQELTLHFTNPYTVHKVDINDSNTPILDMIKRINSISNYKDIHTDVARPLYTKPIAKATKTSFRCSFAPKTHLIIQTDGYIKLTAKEL